MARASALDGPRVSDEDRCRLLDWHGWRPGAPGAESMTPGEEIRWMIETALYGVEYSELVHMASRYIRGGCERFVLGQLDEDIVEDRGVVFCPLHKFM